MYFAMQNIFIHQHEPTVCYYFVPCYVQFVNLSCLPRQTSTVAKFVNLAQLSRQAKISAVLFLPVKSS